MSDIHQRAIVLL